MSGRRCSGTTRSGNQCRRDCPPGEMYCALHNTEAEAAREDQKLDFIHALRTCFSYARACEMAMVSHETARWWREEDPDFAAACYEARSYALDLTEHALVLRSQGQIIEEETRELRQIGEKVVEIDEADGGGTLTTPVYEMVVTKVVQKYIFSDRAAELILRGERAQYRNGYEQTPERPIDPVELEARKIFENPEAAEAMEELLASLDEE